ncbi:MAG TPA: outer membrane protein assembly factor BamB [Steroidobacteraceae bacterium]|jgi:outer membrane protein assembly factor BamB
MRRWIALICVVALAACSATKKKPDPDTPTKLVTFSSSLRVNKVWTAKVDDKKGAALRLGLGLAVEGDRVYAAGHKGDVVALDLKTGHQIWRARTKLLLAGGAGVNGSILAIGTSRGEVIALNAANGANLWKVRLNGEVLAAPAVSDRMVVVRTVDGKLHALSSKDGHELWNQDQQVPRLSLRGTARPIVSGDLVLCGFDNGKVIAVNAGDGSLLWEQTVSPPHGRTELERLVDIDSAVDVSGQDVYAVSFQGRVAMLALDTGQVWWSHEASSYQGLSMDDDELYMSSADGVITAMRRRTGAELWKTNALLNRRLSGVASGDNFIVAADYQGYVHWLDKSSGALAARARSGKARVSNAPIVVGNMTLVINDAGGITAYRTTPLASKPAKSSAAAPATTPAVGSTPATTDGTASPAAGGAAGATPDGGGGATSGAADTAKPQGKD